MQSLTRSYCGYQSSNADLLHVSSVGGGGKRVGWPPGGRPSLGLVEQKQNPRVDENLA